MWKYYFYRYTEKVKKKKEAEKQKKEIEQRETTYNKKKIYMYPRKDRKDIPWIEKLNPSEKYRIHQLTMNKIFHIDIFKIQLNK